MILNPVITGKSLPDIANPGTAADLLTGKQLIGPDGEVISGGMPSVAQATPSITVSSGGLITAKADQSGGKVDAGSRSATKQLTTQGGKTVTPGTNQQTAVYSGRYTTGNIYVAGDPNLISTNIRKGTSIFGVSGSYSGGEPVLEDVEIASVPSAGYVTFTTTKRISKVCSISFFVESMDLYGYYTYLYTLQSNGMLSVHAGKYNSRYAPNYFIGSGGGDVNSGEMISGYTVTYGKGTSGWVAKIPQGSSVYGTICYIPA